MIIKTYGIYDSVAKTLRSTFVSENDAVCIRSCEITAKDPKVDRDTLKDCIVKYLYGVDSESGAVVDATQRDIIAFASILEKVPNVNLDEESFGHVKEMFESIKKSYDHVGEKFHQQSDINEAFSKALKDLSQKVSDIIGGNIKCQKYRKRK